LNQAYLLAGRYEDAFNLYNTKQARSWGYRGTPEGLVIPFFLIFLSRTMHPHPAQNVEQLWKEALGKVAEYDTTDVAERFGQVMNQVFLSVQLSGDEEKKYLDWCSQKIGQNVDSIVGGKSREIYNQAANELVALAEVLVIRSRESDGKDLIEKFRQKYHRFAAFQKELAAAIGKSNLFTLLDMRSNKGLFTGPK
jgi:hypothetical protein